MSSSAAKPQVSAEPGLSRASMLVAIGIFATSFSQPHFLGRLPIQNLLKNELHVSRAANAAFFFWAGLAWYFKPIAGLLTDAFPLFGRQRASYMAMGALLGGLAWIALAYTPHEYKSLLLVCTVITIFMVLASSALAAYMAEAAQALAGTGPLAAVRGFTEQLCLVAVGPAAGFLASIAFHWTAFSCAAFLLPLAPAALFLMREQRRPPSPETVFSNAARSIGIAGKSGFLWAAGGITLLFYIAPGLNTAIFYRQQNDLHLATQTQGFLQLLSGSGGVIAAIIYGVFSSRFSFRSLLVSSLIFGTLANLGYLFYTSVTHAQMIESFNGFGYTLAELALMDLTLRAAPKGSEGLGMAILLSLKTFAIFGTDWLGAQLMDVWHLTFGSLVLSNAFTTVLTVPAALVLTRYRNQER